MATRPSMPGRLWLVVAGVVVLLVVGAVVGQQRTAAPQPAVGATATASAAPADDVNPEPGP